MALKEYDIRTSDQLPGLLQGFRRAAGFTQAQVAYRMGVTQQAYSALERNAATASIEKMVRLFNVLQLDFVIRKSDPGKAEALAKKRLEAGEPNW